jgi:hypothetical protein
MENPGLERTPPNVTAPVIDRNHNPVPVVVFFVRGRERENTISPRPVSGCARARVSYEVFRSFLSISRGARTRLDSIEPRSKRNPVTGPRPWRADPYRENACRYTTTVVIVSFVHVPKPGRCARVVNTVLGSRELSPVPRRFHFIERDEWYSEFGRRSDVGRHP